MSTDSGISPKSIAFLAIFCLATMALALGCVLFL